MRDLGRPETMGIHFLDWKWYDNWEDVQHEALEMSEARAHFLRVKTLLFWCIRGSIRGWHELTETRPGSGVVQIACLRTEWSPHGHWRQRRLGEYHQESLLPALQDLRSLAASLQSVPNLKREHGWLLKQRTCVRQHVSAISTVHSVTRRPCEKWRMRDVRGCPRMSAVVRGENGHM